MIQYGEREIRQVHNRWVHTVVETIIQCAMDDSTPTDERLYNVYRVAVIAQNRNPLNYSEFAKKYLGHNYEEEK